MVVVVEVAEADGRFAPGPAEPAGVVEVVGDDAVTGAHETTNSTRTTIDERDGSLG